MLKTYFIRRVRRLSAVMIVPTLLVFLVVGLFLQHFQRQSMRESSRNTLSSTSESLDASMYSMAHQIDSMMTNGKFTLSFRKILEGGDLSREENTSLSLIRNLYRSYQIAYTHINSIYVYLDGGDNFLSTTTGHETPIRTFYDRDWIWQYESMSPDEDLLTTRRWIQRNTYEEPVEVVSLYYRLTYLKGVIVINVDKSRYGELLRKMRTSDEQTIVLLNTQGGQVAVIGQPGNDNGIWEEFQTLTDQSAADGNELPSDCWVKVGGERYYMYSEKSDYMNLWQISLMSMDLVMSELRGYLLIAAVVLLLDLIIILGLSVVYTRRSFRFIKQYVEIFSAAERGEEIEQPKNVANDEYGLILSNIIYMYLKNSKMKAKVQEHKHQTEMAQMAALQLQINPHFIFNTLQIMDFDVIRRMGANSLPHRMITQLSTVVKYALTDPMERVSIQTEIDYLKSYLEIQKVRFDGAGITYFEVDDSVREDGVFRLLLQPLVENCFEHGMYSDHRDIVIKVKIFDRGDRIQFAVVDSGQGMTPEEIRQLYDRMNNPTSRNIGVTNVNRRLILHYGNESKLHIQSKKGYGTVIRFSIPKAEC